MNIRVLGINHKTAPVDIRDRLSIAEERIPALLDRARHMLLTELSTSRGLRAEQATVLLDKALQKSDLQLPEPL